MKVNILNMKKLIKGLSVLLILVLLISCGGQKKEGGTESGRDRSAYFNS